MLAFVAYRLRSGDKTQTELRDVEIDRRLRGRSEMEAELFQVEQESARRLGTFGLDDLPACEALLAKEEAHVAQLERLGAQLEGLVGQGAARDARRHARCVGARGEQKTSALEALGPIAKEPRARERLEVEVRDQESALERARDDEANARARVEANPVDAEQVAAQAERLAVWREQLAALQRRERVYASTLAAIDRAEQATMKTATRYLEQRMVRDLDVATAGRYRHVRVDDKTLDIEVRAPEKRDWVKVSSLSQGTLDLVYLTARLGLVRLVTGDRRPPLVFDDPFVTLDDDRATRALRAAQGDRRGLPGHLPDDLGSLRQRRRRRRGAARPDGPRRRPGPGRDRVGRRRPDRGGDLTGLDPALLTVVLGLASAAAWGTGDFGGGLISRRAPVLGVVLISQLVGWRSRSSSHWSAARPSPLRSTSAGRSLAGPSGSSASPRCTGRSRSVAWAIVAPVTGVLAAIVPVAAGFVLEGLLAPMVVLGIGLAIASVVLVTRSDDGGTGRDGLGLAVVAGLSIGAFDVVLAQISDGSVFGPLTVVRATEGLLIVAVVLVTRTAWRPPGSLVPGIVGVGAADMAGNAGFILAVQTGALAVAAVLSSLYPVATVILATIFLREPVTRAHAAGIGLAVVAIVLIGIGSA